MGGAFPVLGRKFSVFYAGHPMKDYFIVRNYGYLAKKWSGWRGLLGHMARYSLFYLYRRQPLQALKSLVYPSKAFVASGTATNDSSRSRGATPWAGRRRRRGVSAGSHWAWASATPRRVG